MKEEQHQWVMGLVTHDRGGHPQKGVSFMPAEGWAGNHPHFIGGKNNSGRHVVQPGLPRQRCPSSWPVLVSSVLSGVEVIQYFPKYHFRAPGHLEA